MLFFLCFFLICKSCCASAMWNAPADDLKLNGVILGADRIECSTPAKKNALARTETIFSLWLEDGFYIEVVCGNDYKQLLYSYDNSPLKEVTKEVLEDLFPAYKTISHLSYAQSLPERKLIMLIDAEYIRKNPKKQPTFLPAFYAIFDDKVEKEPYQGNNY